MKLVLYQASFGLNGFFTGPIVIIWYWPLDNNVSLVERAGAATNGSIRARAVHNWLPACLRPS